MKNSVRILALAVGAFLIAALIKANWPKRGKPPETPYQREIRWRSQAESSATNYVEKEVTGFRRMVSIDFMDYDDQVTNWTANAEAEYINHMGGVDRTNLPLRFILVDLSSAGITDAPIDVACVLDYQKVFEKEEADRQEEYRRSAEESRLAMSNAQAVLDSMPKSDFDLPSPIKGVPLAVFNSIEKLAVAIYPNNYAGQQSIIRQQAAAWLKDNPPAP